MTKYLCVRVCVSAVEAQQEREKEGQGKGAVIEKRRGDGCMLPPSCTSVQLQFIISDLQFVLHHTNQATCDETHKKHKKQEQPNLKPAQSLSALPD